MKTMVIAEAAIATGFVAVESEEKEDVEVIKEMQ
jgi:hypothetical protein